jgi:hypothetical protein
MKFAATAAFRPSAARQKVGVRTARTTAQIPRIKRESVDVPLDVFLVGWAYMNLLFP